MQAQTPSAAVSVRGLTMTYRAPVREAGLKAAATSLFRRQYREVAAVRSVSFDLAPGEVVGFIGPNGAGKTTTLKILSGVLHPTSGEARVLGFTPWRREYPFLRQIAFVRGSRPIAGPPELTVLDTLRFQRLVYEVPDDAFRRNLDELVELLGLEPVLLRQVRALSLGERMRAGLATSLVYRPRVLFLDEPTIGLDVSATAVVRRFVAAYARRSGATVLLTSHYMADVETLCRRVVLIDHGTLRYDGDLAGLAARLAPWKLVKVAVVGGDGGPDQEAPAASDWSRYGEVVSTEDAAEGRVSLRVPRHEVPAVTARLLAELPVADLAVEEPPLETVIDQAYREGMGAGEGEAGRAPSAAGARA
jgi:ABC-2 type transport system ATP-binding protein